MTTNLNLCLAMMVKMMPIGDAGDTDDYGDADESGDNGDGEEHDNDKDGDKSESKSSKSKDGEESDEESDEEGEGKSMSGDADSGDQSESTYENYAPGDWYPSSETDDAWNQNQTHLLDEKSKDNVYYHVHEFKNLNEFCI